MKYFLVLSFIIFCAISLEIISGKEKRSFYIDAEGKQFLKDGKPFRYVSGSIHYMRVMPNDWRDRLRKLRLSGCNAVQTYVEWSSHEPEPTEFNFSQGLNLMRFIKIAQEEDLLVILRVGPYICAERDMGGLPYWLLRKKPLIKLRSSDSDYEFYVKRWFDILLPKMTPYLYQNGGPIIMTQIENEYGSYSSCDFKHTSNLRDMVQEHFGKGHLLFTTDGWTSNYLKCGKIANVFATVDFGPETLVSMAFESQRIFEPDGPMVNSEFYPGWLDHWGEPHTTKDTKRITTSLETMLSMNASVNFYVFHGGSNFGLKSGANFGSKYQPCPTSYDYDAPINEAGDLTEKYFAIREVIGKYLPLPKGPIPSPTEKKLYKSVQLKYMGGVLEIGGFLKGVDSVKPRPFEDLHLANGIVIYTTKIPIKIPDPSVLSILDIRDRAYVYVDSQYVGIISRQSELYDLPIYGTKGQRITIVVESQGRIGYGNKINEQKGIIMDVTLGLKTLTNWTMKKVPFDKIKQDELIELLQQKKVLQPTKPDFGGMAFYDGYFSVYGEPADTFLNFDGWTKGYVWINGFLLGRYWPVVGPQITLYLPRSLLTSGINRIRILELEKSPCGSFKAGCKISFTDIPEVNGPTPEWT